MTQDDPMSAYYVIKDGLEPFIGRTVDEELIKEIADALVQTQRDWGLRLRAPILHPIEDKIIDRYLLAKEIQKLRDEIRCLEMELLKQRDIAGAIRHECL
jgi:hypothetical protein